MIIKPIDLLSKSELDMVKIPQSFLQSDFWADFKTFHGWNSLRFVCFPDFNGIEERPFFINVLTRHISGLGTFCYIPGGPEIDCTDDAVRGQFLDYFSSSLRSLLPSNSFCIRYDPAWEVKQKNSFEESNITTSEVIRPIPKSSFLRKAESDVQPPDTVILDLLLTEDEILAAMKPKWRYNCKLAQKKGVEIRFFDQNSDISIGIDIFYSLYLETAKRDGIAIHSKKYYQDLFTTINHYSKSAINNSVSIRLYLAEYTSTPIAAIIVLLHEKEAVYLYGASSNQNRNLMPSYALQWQAICDARNAGCIKYDFYGIPPTNNPSHPMHGLFRFKTGFGGWIIHRSGSYDYPIKPIQFLLFSTAQKIRILWFKKIVKLFRKEIQH